MSMSSFKFEVIQILYITFSVVIYPSNKKDQVQNSFQLKKEIIEL